MLSFPSCTHNETLNKSAIFLGGQIPVDHHRTTITGIFAGIVVTKPSGCVTFYMLLQTQNPLQNEAKN